MIRLSDGEVSIRSMEPSDLETLYKWENDSSLWNVSDTVSPFSKEALRLFIEASLQEIPSDQIRLMVDSDGKTIGCIDLFDISLINHHASVGILLYDKSYRRNGIASKALSLLEEYAYKSLELMTLKAEVAQDNECAMNFFKKNGYNIVGVLSKWKRIEYGTFSDVCIFQHNIYAL